MTVTEFLQRLSYGPLSNLAIGGSGSGTCDPDKVPSLVNYTNEGLLHLYSRFILNERSLIIQMYDAITRYELSSARSRTVTPTDPLQVQYVMDSELDPFTDDLIKVLQIFDDIGREIKMNDQSVYGSIFTPQFNILQIPIPVDGLPLYLSYQAKHAPLVSTALGDTINLPAVLEEALISYVAHKVFFHMNGQEHSAKSNEHLTKYEGVVAEVLDKDLVNSSTSTDNFSKFYERGFR